MSFQARLAVGFLVVTTMAALPRPASASCVDAPTIGEHLAWADAVFVGTVDALANQDRTAVVTIHEIWAGPDLPGRVTVHGGPDEPDVSTSADRSFVAGGRYLFAVFTNDARLEDNACTATQPWAEELAALRPDDAREPAVGEMSTAPLGMELPMPFIVALLGATAVAGAGFLAFRRRA
jgi:hypothetical protein